MIFQTTGSLNLVILLYPIDGAKNFSNWISWEAGPVESMALLVVFMIADFFGMSFPFSQIKFGGNMVPVLLLLLQICHSLLALLVIHLLGGSVPMNVPEGAT